MCHGIREKNFTSCEKGAWFPARQWNKPRKRRHGIQEMRDLILYGNNRPGSMAHACNPSTLGGQGRQITRSMWNPISTKNSRISWAWWRVPVIPATQEAEAGESLEPGSRRLQWAKIAPLHSSLATEQNSVSKNTQRKLQDKNSPDRKSVV